MFARFSGIALVALLSLCPTTVAAQDDHAQGSITEEECMRLRGQWRVPPGRCVLGWRLRSGEFELPDGETLSSEAFLHALQATMAANPGFEVNKQQLGSEVGFAVERVM